MEVIMDKQVTARLRVDTQEVEQSLLQLSLAIRRQDRDFLTRWKYAAGKIIVTKQREAIPAHLALLIPDVEAPAGLLKALEAAMRADGWRIQTRRLSQFTLGLTSTRFNIKHQVFLQRSISVVPYINDGQRVLTLFHEWAHGILHQTAQNLGSGNFRMLGAMQMEIEAEATSWVVGRLLGMNAEHAARYFAERNIGSLQLLAPKTVDNVQKAAEYILARLQWCGNAQKVS
jgi:hypothetical protein